MIREMIGLLSRNEFINKIFVSRMKNKTVLLKIRRYYILFVFIIERSVIYPREDKNEWSKSDDEQESVNIDEGWESENVWLKDERVRTYDWRMREWERMIGLNDQGSTKDELWEWINNYRTVLFVISNKWLSYLIVRTL